MADIKIKHNETPFGRETNVEVIGVEYGADELTKAILNTFGRAGMNSAEVNITTPDEQATQQAKAVPGLCKLRMIVNGDISPEDFKTAISEGNVDELISPFDEIEIPLDTGGSVTVVCGYSDSHTARFVMKDCWDEAVMNEENTNKTGYFKSRGRAHVLADILPHIAQEWREIFKPRQMVEIIDGERVEYADLMWLPSATDVFGPSEDGYWKDEGDNFQLPIFEKERDRVKECGDEGTCVWWLRSVNASITTTFRHVNASGGSSGNLAINSLGFAPGFDI